MSHAYKQDLNITQLCWTFCSELSSSVMTAAHLKLFVRKSLKKNVGSRRNVWRSEQIGTWSLAREPRR